MNKGFTLPDLPSGYNEDRPDFPTPPENSDIPEDEAARQDNPPPKDRTPS